MKLEKPNKALQKEIDAGIHLFGGESYIRLEQSWKEIEQAKREVIEFAKMSFNDNQVYDGEDIKKELNEVLNSQDTESENEGNSLPYDGEGYSEGQIDCEMKKEEEKMEIKTSHDIFMHLHTPHYDKGFANKKWVAVNDIKKEIENILDHWNHRNNLDTRRTINTVKVRMDELFNTASNENKKEE